MEQVRLASELADKEKSIAGNQSSTQPPISPCMRVTFD